MTLSTNGLDKVEHVCIQYDAKHIYGKSASMAQDLKWTEYQINHRVCATHEVSNVAAAAQLHARSWRLVQARNLPSPLLHDELNESSIAPNDENTSN